MRRRRAEKRERIPDIKYKSELVSYLINVVMRRGKKTVAQRIVYDALETVGQKLSISPLEAFLTALDNCKPQVEVKSRRVGGANYQVPVEIEPGRQVSLALRWLVAAAAERKGVSMTQALAQEIIDAYNNTGNVVRKRDETHRMAAANRAFAHYRW